MASQNRSDEPTVIALTATEHATLRRATLAQLVASIEDATEHLREYMDRADLNHTAAAMDAQDYARRVREDLDALNALGWGRA